MNEVTFGSLEYMPFLLIILIICAIAIYRVIKIRKSVYALIGKQTQLLKNYSMYKLIFQCFLFSTAIVCLFAGLLSPQLSQLDAKIQKKGRNLFIALDVSKSMNAVDCNPTRLACAKKKIEALVNERSGSDSIGLILFSGCAFVLCPLTNDYQAFMNMLKMVDTETIASGTTALDQPILCAIKAFNAIPQNHKHLILFTDGEDFTQQIEQAKLQAEKENIKLYAVGIGTTQGSPIAIIENNKLIGHLKDEQGTVIISRLHEAVLVQLTQKLGGVYIKMSEDQQDIVALNNAIEQSESEDLEFVQRKGKQLYPFLAAITFLLLSIQWIL